MRLEKGYPVVSQVATFEHPDLVTTAQTLHRWLNAAGRSVYWNKNFTDSGDPTFIFLNNSVVVRSESMTHAWDETLEALYAHI